MAHNPWTDLALANDYHLGDRREAALIAADNDNDAPVTCGQCSAKAYYRATVGAIQCYTCRSIEIRRWNPKTQQVEVRWS